MSGPTVHIIGNADGSNDQLAIIIDGELIHKSRCQDLDARTLKDILLEVNGFQRIHYHSTDDEGMKNVRKVVYPED